jgi:hypothetical protein
MIDLRRLRLTGPLLLNALASLTISATRAAEQAAHPQAPAIAARQPATQGPSQNELDQTYGWAPGFRLPTKSASAEPVNLANMRVM